jgi:hypothetical protein
MLGGHGNLSTSVKAPWGSRESRDSPNSLTHFQPQHLQFASTGQLRWRLIPEMARTALFVIDIQVGIAQDPATEIRCAQRVRDAGTELLARSRAAITKARTQNQQADLEIVVVQHEETPESGTLLEGSKAWEVVFKPRGGDHGERFVSKNVRE